MDTKRLLWNWLWLKHSVEDFPDSPKSFLNSLGLEIVFVLVSCDTHSEIALNLNDWLKYMWSSECITAILSRITLLTLSSKIS